MTLAGAASCHASCHHTSADAPSDAPALPAPPPPPPRGHPQTAFVDVTVETMDSDQPLLHRTVVVDGATITKLCEPADCALPADTVRVDGRGKFLIPGLHDMHVHLDGTKGMLTLFVANGVTTVRNMAGSARTIALRAKIASGELLGPTISTTGPFVDGERPRWEASASVVTAVDAEHVVAEHLAAGYDFVKVYNGLTVGAYDAVAAQAKLHGLRLVGHVPFKVPLAHALETGQASVEHLSGFAEAIEKATSPVRHQHGSAPIIKRWMYADPAKITAVVADVVKHHTYDTPTLVTAAAYGELYRGHLPEGANGDLDEVSPDWRARWDPKHSPKHYDAAIRKAMDEAHDKALATEGAIVKQLADAGAPILAGTDTPNPYVIPGPSLHQELEMMVAAGLTPYAALRTATVVPGEFLGDSHDGRIAIGAHADLVLIDGDPLADIHAIDKIAGVMVRGRWLPAAELKALRNALVAKYKNPAWEAPLDLGPEAATWKTVQYVVSDNGAPVGAYAMATHSGTILEREALEDEVSSTKILPSDHHARTIAIDVERPEGTTHATFTKKDRALVGWLSPATAMAVVAPVVATLAIGDKKTMAIDTPNSDAPGTLERGSLTIERLPDPGSGTTLEYRLRLVLDHVAQVGRLAFEEGSTVPRSFKISSTTRPVFRTWQRR
jgi:imidazolonepropionase-like amidohydrolase